MDVGRAVVQAVAGRALSPRKLGFDPRLVQVGFIVDIVALGRVFLWVLLLSSVFIMSLGLNTQV
jgi:hypothetical protein